MLFFKSSWSFILLGIVLFLIGIILLKSGCPPSTTENIFMNPRSICPGAPDSYYNNNVGSYLAIGGFILTMIGFLIEFGPIGVELLKYYNQDRKKRKVDLENS